MDTILQSTLVTANSSLVSSLARVRNTRTGVFQSNVCNLFSGIWLLSQPRRPVLAIPVFPDKLDR